MKFIDKMMENIKNIESEYYLKLNVETCIYELKDDYFIGYKRLDYFFEYVKKNFNLDKNFFYIYFRDVSWCNRNQDENISFIDFSLQYDWKVSVISSQVNGVSFQNVSFEKNQITPSKDGCEFLLNVRKNVKESFELNKYKRMRIQIFESLNEKDNTFVTYERIQFLYDFFEGEINHDDIEFKIEFQIIDDVNIEKSYMQFKLLDN